MLFDGFRCNPAFLATQLQPHRRITERKYAVALTEGYGQSLQMGDDGALTLGRQIGRSRVMAATASLFTVPSCRDTQHRCWRFTKHQAADLVQRIRLAPVTADRATLVAVLVLLHFSFHALSHMRACQLR